MEYKIQIYMKIHNLLKMDYLIQGWELSMKEWLVEHVVYHQNIVLDIHHI